MNPIPAEFFNFPTVCQDVVLEYVVKVGGVQDGDSFWVLLSVNASGENGWIEMRYKDKDHALKTHTEFVNAVRKYRLYKELLKSCRFVFESER